MSEKPVHAIVPLKGLCHDMDQALVDIGWIALGLVQGGG